MTINRTGSHIAWRTKYQNRRKILVKTTDCIQTDLKKCVRALLVAMTDHTQTEGAWSHICCGQKFTVVPRSHVCCFCSVARSSRVYMGCSDVSEFEYIYGQILTTPFCVYGTSFTRQ